MSTSQTMNRSQSRKHYHEKSIQDFMKNMKKYNLRSERYISPKPLLYMYAKNNTAQTIERSRSKTLSHNKSPHSKSKRSKKDKSTSLTLRNKLEKILKADKQPSSKRATLNPAFFIERCGEKLKKSQRLLEGKSSVGSLLCKQFLSMLNEIVERMVKQLDAQLKQIYNKTERQVETRFTAKIQKMQKIQDRMSGKITELTQRLENNTKLVYWLRKESQLDIDYIFGQVVLGTDQCGGHGYSKNRDGSSAPESDRSSGLLIPDRLQNLPLQNQLPVHHQAVGEGLPTLTGPQETYRHITTQQDIEEEESSGEGEHEREGRIRQAYDWEREAHWGRHADRGDRDQIAEQFGTGQGDESDRIRPHRKST